eukprot:1432155-Karenia_brevis.AAC.2
MLSNVSLVDELRRCADKLSTKTSAGLRRLRRIPSSCSNPAFSSCGLSRPLRAYSKTMSRTLS